MVQPQALAFGFGLHHTRAEDDGVPSGCFSRVTLPVKAGQGHPVLLQLLDEQDLMDIVARQPIRRGDQDPVQTRTRRSIAQAVQARTPEARAAVAIVAEDVLRRQNPALRRGMSTQAIELLLSGLRLDLALGRNPSIT